MDAPPDSPRDTACQREERTGGSFGSPARPAFEWSAPPGLPLPVLIAVPHGGRDYPAALLARMRDPARTTLRLEDRLIDTVGAQVASDTGAALLVARAPRALIDLNRAPDDVDWAMIDTPPPNFARLRPSRRSRSGLGLIPRRLAGLGEIWRDRLSQAELEQRLAQVHRPYHQALGLALEAIRDRWGAALLVDLHSMPPLGRHHPYEAAAEFVIGDRFGASCDPALAALAVDCLARNGRVAVRNRPYAGGYVLDRHAQPARGIHCLQIEVCRSSYLDAQMVEPSARLPALVRLLCGMVRELAASLDRSGSALPLAAE